jgi:hypothetical protein
MSKQELKAGWCRMMHEDVAFGGGPHYWCRKCLCRFPVPWLTAQYTNVKPIRRQAVVLTSRGPVPVATAVRRALAA